ncbi:unnamed protein product [Victoria cruziana]
MQQGMANHIERNVFLVLITAAIFASVVDGRYDSFAIPPVRPQEVSYQAPSPHAFSIDQLLSSRRGLIEPIPATSRAGYPFLPQAPSNGFPQTTSNGEIWGYYRSEEYESRTYISVGAIVGIVVGGAALLILIGVAVAWRYKQKGAASTESWRPGALDHSSTTQQCQQRTNSGRVILPGEATPARSPKNN